MSLSFAMLRRRRGFVDIVPRRATNVEFLLTSGV
jgi:hypothetical protein